MSCQKGSKGASNKLHCRVQQQLIFNDYHTFLFNYQLFLSAGSVFLRVCCAKVFLSCMFSFDASSDVDVGIDDSLPRRR